MRWGKETSRPHHGAGRTGWCQLPTKYLTEEPGYVGRLASVAAEPSEEFGLDAYAAVCRFRFKATAAVHGRLRAPRFRGDYE